MLTLVELKAHLMENLGFRAAYAEADAEFQVTRAMIRAGIRPG